MDEQRLTPPDNARRFAEIARYQEEEIGHLRKSMGTWFALACIGWGIVVIASLAAIAGWAKVAGWW